MKAVRYPKPLAFWLCLVTSIGLLVGSFLVPPMGVVDPSVLASVGELFAFATLGIGWKAVQEGMRAKVTHGETTIEVGDAD